MVGVLSDNYIHEEVGLPKDLYAAIIFYNDTLPLLKECVRSCHRIGLKTIMIDGKFSAYEDDNKYFHSTDGCMEYAKSVADIFIPAPRKGWHDQWGGQPTKRTQYFKVCDENDFVIVIDGDEGFKTTSRVNIKSLTYRYMRLKLWNYASHHTIVNVRGFRVYKDLCYMRRHCAVYRTSFIRKSASKNKLEGLAIYNRERLKPMKALSGEELVMVNYDSLRSKQRQKWDDIYMLGRKEDKTLPVVKRISRYNPKGFVGGGISKEMRRRMDVTKRLEQVRRGRRVR
jgi:hypothetical protein